MSVKHASVLSWVCYCCSLAAGCGNTPRVTMRAEQLQGVHRVAVLPFTDAPGADAGYSGRVVAQHVASAALYVPGWSVVERDRVKRIFDEGDLSATNLVDPDTAIRVGKLVAADGVVFGEVAQYRIGSAFFPLDVDVYKVDFLFRLVSVRTGEVCLAAQLSQSSLKSFDDAISKGLSTVFEMVALQLESGVERTSTSASDPATSWPPSVCLCGFRKL